MGTKLQLSKAAKMLSSIIRATQKILRVINSWFSKLCLLVLQIYKGYMPLQVSQLSKESTDLLKEIHLVSVYMKP